MLCAHDGNHSGSSVYDRQHEILHFILLCDDCGAVVRTVDRQPYRPVPVERPPREQQALARLAIELVEP